MKRGCVVAAALSLVTAAAGQGGEERAIGRVVERFFGAVAARNAEAALSEWSRHSPERSGWARVLPAAFAYQAKAPPSGIELGDYAIDGNRASVVVRFDGKWSAADEQFDDERKTAWRLELRKEGESWRLWAQEAAGIELMRRLVRAPNRAARAKLLEDNRDLAGSRLVSFLETAGESLMDGGKHRAALVFFVIDVEVCEVIGNDLQLALALFQKATVVGPLLSRTAASVSIFERALRHAQKGGSATLEMNIRNGLASVLADLGRLDEAVAHGMKSLEIARREDPFGTRPITENMVAYTFWRRGDYERAAAWSRRSAATARSINRPDLEMQALSHLAPALRMLGDLGGALAASEKGLEIAKTVAAPVVRAKLLNTVGLVQLDTGNYAKAIDLLGQAAEIWQAAGLTRLHAIALGNIGDTCCRQGRYADAVLYHTRSLEAAKTLSHEVMVVTNALINLGLVYRLRGNYAKAREYYEQGREAAKQRGYVTGRIYAACNLADLGLVQHDYSRALEGFEDVLAFARRKASIEGEHYASVGIGLALSRRNGPGDLGRAATAFRNALAKVEMTRSSLDDPMLQQGFFARSGFLCQELATTLLRLQRPAEAFAASERAKARTVVDLLRGARFNVVKAMTADDQRRESELESTVNELAKKIETTFRTDAYDALVAELEKTRAELEGLRRSVFRKQPSLRTLRGRFEPVTLDTVRGKLLAGDSRLCLVSYLVGADEVLLFVVRDELEVRRIKIARRELRRRVARFWSQCATAGTSYRKDARALFDLLLGPAAAELEGTDTLVIVPDDCLHGLPFEALVDPAGKHLVETHRLSRAPSVTALAEMVSLSDKRRRIAAPRLAPLLALGAPVMPAGYAPLDNAKVEVESIAKAYGVEPVTGPAATESRAKAAMPGARRIHIATHGEVDAASPMYSFLVLGRSASDDGLLHAREIAEIDLNADLVVLSACETGRGKQVRGEGIVGLTWALLVAGAPSQVVTLWQVPDAATSKLMTKLYAELDQTSKAEALRRAQVAAIADPRRSHPYFWAPFFLVGDWR